MLADPSRVDPLAHRLDDPCPFVTEHHRQRRWPLSVEQRKIAPADSRGEKPDEHLLASRLLELQLVRLNDSEHSQPLLSDMQHRAL